MKKSVLAAVMTGLCALPAAPALSEINALQLVRTMGRQIGDLVFSAPYAYIATGRVVVTWDYSDPSAPTQVGAVVKPAKGPASRVWSGMATISTRAGGPATAPAAWPCMH